MGVIDIWARSAIAKYVKAVRAMPREVLFNRHLILSAMMYAMCGVPQTWDQGPSATVPSLEGFQAHFGLSSGSDAEQIGTFVSIIYVGYTVGAGASFFFNNRLGRLWSYRLYVAIWIIGQLIAIFAPNLGALYAARIVAGIGIGSVTVAGPMALVEIAPAEIRGLLTSWYVVAVSAALMASTFSVYGIINHVPASRLQYQIAWFAPCIYKALCILVSFFCCESPRWLLLVNRRKDAVETLVHLRGLPANHPRVTSELDEIENDIARSQAKEPSNTKAPAKEMFTKTTNLRHLQQVLVSYALAQLSGANSITSYFVPTGMVGQGSKNPADSIFLSGIYSFAKLLFTLLASFFFVNALGRRKSLLIGVTLQMISHVYISVFIKKKQEGPVPQAASEGAITMLFVHAFGYSVGKGNPQPSSSY